jgi:hypothetical protein
MSEVEKRNRPNLVGWRWRGGVVDRALVHCGGAL